jgi:hypothetical protein
MTPKQYEARFKQLGLSKRKVASLTGLQYRTFLNWFNGRTVKPNWRMIDIFLKCVENNVDLGSR